MIQHSRLGTRVLFGGLLCILSLFMAACWDRDEDNVQLADQNPAETGNSPDLESVRNVEELMHLILSEEQDQLRGHLFEIDAWISPAPASNGASSTPPQGCPVVPEKQDWLSDEPIATQIEVAGATIPNERLSEEKSLLRLVVPYNLGFVEIPERATLRGYVLDEAHAECPGAESLFILDEIVESLPPEGEANESELISEWEQYTHEDSGIVLEYPAGWEVEERDTGHLVRIRFLGPDNFRTIRFEVHEGETYWNADASESITPEVLRGNRQEPASAGPAHARLVDDRERTSAEERELRLVFNHQGRTIFLAMVVRDGAELDTDAIWVFNEMAHRLRLQGDVAMSDPMDPILAASDEIGAGPFLSEADAMYAAVNASGMTAAEAVSAELVSERQARDAIDGACRDFDGRPPGVWLVAVDGVTPNGREAYRLVYLDASTGDRLCQAEAPGVS
jgi:hypothetical protein